MQPPSADFTNAVTFPMPAMVVGKFAGIKAALIQTKPGRKVTKYVEDAIREYPSALFVIGVGVCYAFDKEKHNFADVLVSETICDFMNFKFNDEGEIIDRGQVVNVVYQLTKIFCFKQKINFVVSM